MQRGRGGRDGFFGFGGPFPGFSGSAPPGSLMSSFFGGTNPFDDPFFTNPFGAIMGPSLFQQSIFGSSMFGPHRDLNGAVNNAGGFLQQAPEPSRQKGPIIKELSSDDEDDADVNKEDEKKEGNTRKHPRMSKEPYVEDPDEEVQDNKRPKHEQFGREYVRASTSCPQPQTFMFQSSTVTYGGPNGACYSSSNSRRTGGDGIRMEERKEADRTTGKASHRISRGIGNKGHSLTRKLNCDGKVNTMQSLHNLNEDELAVFEESWQRNAGQNLPGWDPRVSMIGSGTLSLSHTHARVHVNVHVHAKRMLVNDVIEIRKICMEVKESMAITVPFLLVMAGTLMLSNGVTKELFALTSEMKMKCLHFQHLINPVVPIHPG